MKRREFAGPRRGLYGLRFFLALSFLAATGSLSALNLSTGPDITDNTIIGPNGARIKPVWNTSIFGLTGVDKTGTPTSIGQYEPSEPFQNHVMLTDPRVGLHNIGAANNSHATNVASIIIGLPLGNLRGVAHHNSTVLYSAGGDYYTHIRNWLTRPPRPVRVMNQSSGFEWQDNELQLVRVRTGVTGGTYTLTFNGLTTGPLNHNASAAALQLALNALRPVGMRTDFVVAEMMTPGDGFQKGYRVEFDSFLGGQNQAQLTGNTFNLVGGPPNKLRLNTPHEGSAMTFNNGQSAASLFADYLVQDRNFLWVKSAGNDGVPRPIRSLTMPADAYNVLTVGATGVNPANPALTGQDYTRVAPYSSRGPTNDANPRHKLELVAPGSAINSAEAPMAPATTPNNITASHDGTSYAAPHVAGTVALLMDNARNDTLKPGDRRTLKAILSNSASKHVRDPLNGDRAWPQSPAAQYTLDGGSFLTRIPLDDAMGAGQLNAFAALRQHQDFATTGLFSRNDYLFNGTSSTSYFLNASQELKRGSLVVATLAWDRITTLKSGVEPTVENFRNAASYDTKTIDLDLRLTKEDGTVVARSASFYDSVEHLYFNVREDGKYRIEVKGFTNHPNLVDFGIAVSASSASGISFSVDGGHFNNARRAEKAPNPAEGLYAPQNFASYPNDLNALGPAGPGHFPTEAEIFSGGGERSLNRNMQRLSGALGTQSRVGPHNGPPAAMAVLDGGQRGVLGLRPNDNVGGLSFGRDGTQGKNSVLVFSIDTDARGAANSGVRFWAEEVTTDGRLEATIRPTNGRLLGDTVIGNSAAGNLYASSVMPAFGKYASDEKAPTNRHRKNRLHVPASSLGLQETGPRGQLLNNLEDDLDAVEMDDILTYVDSDGDGMHNKPVFFTLDKWSPSLAAKGFSTADVFVSHAPDTSNVFGLAPNNAFDFDRYATRQQLGLAANDIVDALAVSDIGFNLGGLTIEPDGTGTSPLDILGNQIVIDELLFSLAPGSATLMNMMHPVLNRLLSAADILYSNLDGSYSVFASAEHLGLLVGDNLDALDIFSTTVPEPASCVLLLVGAAVCMQRRRKR